MSTQKVEASVTVKSENFHQNFEESINGSSTVKESSLFYEELIAANERLKASLSKVFTEFVNKARLEQESNGDKKKRKTQRNCLFVISVERIYFVYLFFLDDEDEEEEVQEDEDDDAESSDNDEEEQ